jgi:glycosyltransferase involved in cell wall biosynthesis
VAEGSADPLVDVGIPAYGRPAYLRESVESVLSQTMDRWLLWISEDGPGSTAVAEAVKPYLTDPRIRYSVAGERLGPAGNKNILLRAGSAPFVAILDDDDRWHPAFLARRVSFLEEHPECGFVFSAVNEIDEAGQPFRQAGFFDREGVLASSDFVPRLLETNFVHTPSVLVRRSAYRAVGEAFDESLTYIYDAEMWFRLATRFPVGYLARCDADYRVHRSQVSFGIRPAQQILDFLDQAEAIVKRNGWDIPSGPRLRSQWLLSAALDELERGKRREAAAHLGRAMKIHPRAAADRRTVAVLAGLVLGQRAGRFVGGSAREWARRHRWRRAARRVRANP